MLICYSFKSSFVNGVDGDDSSGAEQKRSEQSGSLQRKQERDIDGKKAPHRLVLN